MNHKTLFQFLLLLAIDTHVTVKYDGPHEAQNDWRSSVYDIWYVYIHQFDLKKPTKQKKKHMLKLKRSTGSDVMSVCWILQISS